MNGPGTACPKSSLKVQTEVKIEIKLGDPIRVEANDKVAEIVKKIDHTLQELLDVATRLERRFFTDLREIVDQRGLDEVGVSLKHWRNQGGLVYVILDCIYALPMKLWHGLLAELANLLRHDCTKEDLTALRNRIADLF